MCEVKGVMENKQKMENKMKVKINNKIRNYTPTLNRFGRNIDCVEFNDGTKIVKVGMFCNWLGYSDVTPYEIVDVNKSGKTITIREMDAKLVDSFKPEFIAGGFSANCTNQNEQEYDYTSIKDGYTQKVRMSKKGFGLGRFKISYVPCKFHDYNF